MHRSEIKAYELNIIRFLLSLFLVNFDCDFRSSVGTSITTIFESQNCFVTNNDDGMNNGNGVHYAMYHFVLLV